jgi:hypothetical protein
MGIGQAIDGGEPADLSTARVTGERRAMLFADAVSGRGAHMLAIAVRLPI